MKAKISGMRNGVLREETFLVMHAVTKLRPETRVCPCVHACGVEGRVKLLDEIAVPLARAATRQAQRTVSPKAHFDIIQQRPLSCFGLG